MKIDIEECAALRETEVLIRCRKADERVASIVSSLQMHDLRVAGKSDGEMASVPAAAILYVEYVDSRTFAYTQDSVLAGIAALFSWFPVEYPAAWISFAVAYLVILGILSLVFTCVCKRQIKELNDNLAAYKQQHRQ